MLEGPIGAASFNNEFGRPAICGYFRTFEQHGAGDPPRARARLSQADHDRRRPGQRAPRARARRPKCPSARKLVVLGGPAMLIGLGGGAASSVGSGASSADLDFASVQRGNPEIQRRAQEVIDHCWALGARQPHRADPRRRRRRPLQRGAGGGGAQRARRAHRPAQRSRAPRAACRRWSCGATRRRSATCWRIEAQALRAIRAIAARERCPFAVIGEIDGSGQLRVHDPLFDNEPVDMPLEVLLGKPPRLTREVRSAAPPARALRHAPPLDLREAALPRAAPAGRGRQDLPHHHRRSHRRRTDQPRPAGRALAGAGERCGGDPRRLPRPRRRGDGDGRAHARWRCWMRPPPGAWRWPRRSPTSSPPTSTPSATSACRPTGWPPAASPARTRRSTTTVQRGGQGAVPGARHRDSGRQGLAVDEDRVARGRRRRRASSRRCR